MILAHLGDLHLGYRAYDRLEQGRNARERDVERAFERAVQELIRLEPDLLLLVGDIFDDPRPPPSALLALVRGIDTLRSSLPGVRVLAVAGRRDTPLSPADPGPVAALDALAGVEAVAGTARSVYLEDEGLHALLVPYRAAVEEPWLELRPDPEARRNLLVVPGGIGSRGPEVRLSDWDYVALGGGHSHGQVAATASRAGSLERVGPRPWEEAAEEKGFVTHDLERRRSAFHLVSGRPVVELAPTPVDPADPGSINERIREVVEGIPGGVADKVVHLDIEGLRPDQQELLDARYLARVRREALHLHVEIRPRPSSGSRGRLGAPGALLERLRAVLQEGGAPPEEAEGVMERAEAILDWNDDAAPSPQPGRGGPVLVEGADPVLGSVSLELAPGLTALLAEHHRAREALVSLVGRWWDDRSGAGAADPRLLWPEPGLRLKDLLTVQVRAAARSRALDAVEGALGELRGGAGSDPGGAQRSQEIEDPEEELRRLAGRIRRLEGIPEELRALERELRELRATAAEVGGDLEFRTMEWLRERQDAETHLQAYRDRARELKARYREIESAGEDASCPTCGRPLGEHRGRVIDALREEWEAVVQDGQWWKRRREQLEPKPEHLQELEGRSLRLHAAIEELAERLERRRAELDDVGALRSQEADLRSRLRSEPGERDGAGPGGPRDARLLRRALERVRTEILDEARDKVLLETGDLLGAVSGGRYGALVERDGSLAFLLDGRPEPIFSREDRAMAALAVRLGGAVAAAEAGAPLPPLLVLGPDLDALPTEEWVAAVWAIRKRSDRLVRVAIVSHREKLERAPEAFQAVLDVEPGAYADEEGGEARRLPVAAATIRLDS